MRKIGIKERKEEKEEKRKKKRKVEKGKMVKGTSKAGNIEERGERREERRKDGQLGGGSVFKRNIEIGRAHV